ncbi:MAG: cytochrome c3 family protein [Acidobacteriota bacterium]|nr:cytochrome c3 family protein [Acidobacteriota bacterium]
MKIKAILFSLVLTASVAMQAQSSIPTADVIGVHDLGSWGPSPVQGALWTCMYCHAPHGGLHGVSPLWSQKLSTATYTQLYTSTTMTNTTAQPAVGSSSNLCLSCHDGTVAPGQNTPYGNLKMRGSMNSQDLIAPSGSLQGVHPFNFQLSQGRLLASDNILASLSSSGTTGSSAVKLVNGNVQCVSCHDPHVQNLDSSSGAFLVMDNTDSALCLACHVTTPTEISGMALRKKTIGTIASASSTGTISSSSSNTTSSTYNALSAWTTSSHALSTNRVSKTVSLGKHGDLHRNGCASCHKSHNAPGGASLLTAPTQAIPNMDAVSQNCATCHNGGSNISPAISNVFAEIEKTTGHPLPAASNRHSRNESAVLNNNRHATCVDCHEPHASKTTGDFTLTTIRPAQNGARGVSATDSTTVMSPAQNQYETCLRCHGASSGKKVEVQYGYAPTRLAVSGDPLNVIAQLGTAAKSSHPVMHDRNSAYAQPSLRKSLLNLDGQTVGRVMNQRILCTDCHNSDDNREFGGSGPNGPHGSKYTHILERRYEFSQIASGAAPGSTIVNLLPAVTDPAAGGPYSLCAKCHDLGNVMLDASFSKHSMHIKAGFSCSACHTAHGTATSGSISGDRLINFDLNVVGVNDVSKAAISYTSGTNNCTLKCHNYNHNADGTVALSTAATSSSAKSTTVKH